MINRRRSQLPDPCAPLPLNDLATVLALSAGRSPDRPELRVTPSGGALYPVDAVVIASQIDGLTPGAYLYDPLAHALRPRLDVDPARFHREAGGPMAPPQPSCTVALVATFGRTRAKYALRGYRFALLEAGHLAQAVIVAATALEHATLPWGGFLDAAVDRAFELDGVQRSCVYLVALSGRPR